MVTPTSSLLFPHRLLIVSKGMTSRFLNVSINVRDRAHVCYPALHCVLTAHNVYISNIKREFLRCYVQETNAIFRGRARREIKLKP